MGSHAGAWELEKCNQYLFPRSCLGMHTRIKTMTLSTKIFLGLGTGILVGLFFGEMVGFLQILADIYILLLQMTVLPYVTLSLIAGFGNLNYTDAKLLAIKGSIILAIMWAIAVAVLILMPLAFPDWQSAAFYSSALVESRSEVNYLEIFIPSNPFSSMSKNFVPAVVVFSICVGVALIGVKDKQHLIQSFSILKEALTRVTNFMVSLMPIGIFVIAASASGTLKIAEFEKLKVFLSLYISIALLFTFWILPGLVAALTTIKYRDIMQVSKNAMITAFMTATLLVVLPLLTENSVSLLKKNKLKTDRSQAVLDAAIPTSFNFPQTGKIMALSFILFAAWFSDNPLPVSDYPLLIVSGITSFFGSLTVAVPFLLDLFRLPADLFQLFIVSGVINSRFGTLLAAMHTLVLGLLVCCAVTGQLQIKVAKITRYGLITVMLVIATIAGNKLLFDYGLSGTYDSDKILGNMNLIHEPVDMRVFTSEAEHQLPDESGLSKRAAIRKRGILRVGYLSDNLPFVFFNGNGNLIGFDVEMSHILAKEMGVSLEFVPVKRGELDLKLDSNYCDIIMSGVVETMHRAERMNFTTPYLVETAAFVVKDYLRQKFATAEDRAGLETVRIADMSNANPDYKLYVQRYFPQAALIPAASAEAFFTDTEDRYDATLTTAERGSAWSLIYPHYTVVLPYPNLLQVPLSYPISYRYPAFAEFISTWVRLKQMDGSIKQLQEYWIYGKNAVPAKPRWSIIRNVLHWVD